MSKEIIQTHLPKPSTDTKILYHGILPSSAIFDRLCGPPPMVKAMQQHCEDIGFEKARVISKLEDQVFKF